MSDSEDEEYSRFPRHFGILKKRNRHVWGDTYSTRFFTMYQNVLCYFEKREELSEKISVKEYVRRFRPKAIFDLSDAVVKTSGANFISIEFRDRRQLELHCVDIKERDIWARKLTSSIKAANQPSPSSSPTPGEMGFSSPAPARTPGRKEQRNRAPRPLTRQPTDDNEIPDRLLTKAIYRVLRDVQRLNPGWELVKVCNGLRIYEEKLSGSSSHSIPTFKAIGVVYAPPRDVFKLFMDNSELRRDWDLTFKQGIVCSEDTPNSDTVKVETNPLQMYPLFADPREYAYYRYWKREDDGSYSIILSPPNTVQTSSHKHGVVQAELFGGCILITPSDDDDCASVVTYALQLDPKAFYPHVRAFEVVMVLTAALGSYFGYEMLHQAPLLGVLLGFALMLIATVCFGKELLCALVGATITSQVRRGFIQAFHVEMLMAVAGLRDMINQTPGLDDLLSDTSQVGSVWSDTELPRKRSAQIDVDDSAGSSGEQDTPSPPSSVARPLSSNTTVSSDEVFAKLRACGAKHSWFGMGPSDLSGKHSWADLPGDDFIVRGPNYLNDRVKMPSDGTLMPVVLCAVRRWAHAGRCVWSCFRCPTSRATSVPTPRGSSTRYASLTGGPRTRRLSSVCNSSCPARPPTTCSTCTARKTQLRRSTRPRRCSTTSCTEPKQNKTQSLS
eukprot:TRINITY_DN1675_c0_g1_i2.p1 TRINITY_DN1675_c0_g1~~TRINITY_DN1675_c0_g1_i2.p1  ORF type:complete len:671 (-),score=153.72 TRINITY_DN1675_c0_g1_i2:684-2696(-)